MNPFIRLGSLLIGKTTKELILGLTSMFRTCHKIRTAQSEKGLALFLKASSTYLMKAWSGDPLLDQKAYGPVIGLNRKGIPLWLPHAFRIHISKRNVGIFRVVMTVCNLYRVLSFQGKLNLSTITAPRCGDSPLELKKFISSDFSKKVTQVIPFPHRLGWSPSFLSTKGPGSQPEMNTMSGFGYALRAVFETNMASHFESYAKSVGLVNQLSNLRIIWSGTRDYCPIGPIGKLAFKQEPGKIRVFAMVDCVTQWFLQPLHLWLFSVLSAIPQDATFDQEKGIRKVSNALSTKLDKRVFSFDLSAATDRLPLDIQILLLNSFREGLGDSWGNILVDRDYMLPKYSGYKPGSSVRYAVGQPMGALSSWAMLALTHHAIVQFAAKTVGFDRWFTEYMVLGDDIVIYNHKVAKAYSDLMSVLGVGISPTKSLVSSKGVFEFAKRLIGPEGPAQGLPLAEFSAARFNINILLQSFRGRSLTVPLSLFMRFFGFGYKVLGSLGTRLGDFQKRSGLVESLAYAPGLTNKSLLTWGQWYYHCSKSDLYPLITSLIFRVYKLIPSPPVTDGWNVWTTFFPYLSEDLICSLDMKVSRNLEMMFSNMFDKKLIAHKEDCNKFINTLASLEVDVRDWESLTKIIDLISSAPLSGSIFVPDIDEVGRILSLSLSEDLKVRTSTSLPVEVLIKSKQLEVQSIEWEEPILWDLHSEDWDIQILD